MSEQFLNTIQNLDTIDQALLYVPSILALEGQFSAPQKQQLYTIFKDIVTENEHLLKQRYIDEISDHEKSLLKKIGTLLELALLHENAKPEATQL